MTTEKILASLHTDAFLLNSNIPLGYTAGLPMLSLRNGKPCFVVPYLKYQMTGKVDLTLVYPTRYVVTLSASHATVVNYADLTYDRRFEKIDFNKPIGLFRHAAIRHLSRDEYRQKRRELYALLDSLCASMEGKGEFDDMDRMKLANLYSMLLEPSLRAFYHAIDRPFFEAYITQ